MGIDISQWRAAIGRFRHYGIKKDFCSNSEHQQEHFVLIQLPKLELKNFQTHFQQTKRLAFN